MQKNLLKLSGLLTLIVILLVVPVKINSQDKSEKCEKLFECYRNYYDECFENALFDFTPKLVEAFGITTLEEEWIKLDSAATFQQNSPNSILYIVIYGGKINKKGELKERANRLIYYLVETRKFDSTKVKTINGGFREKFEFELWVSRSEKILPPLSPTVNVESVKFKGKMKPLQRELGN